MADEFVKSTLIDWGLSYYIALFQYHRIDQEAFQLLTADVISELFPKIGDRVKFIKKHQLLYFVNLKNRETYDYTQSSILVPNTEVLLDDLRPSLESDNFNSISDIEDTSTSSKAPEASISKSEFSDGLETHLRKIPDGKFLISRKHNLNEYCRKKLCKIVIDVLLSKYDNRIPKNAFISVSKEIEKVFPGENRFIYFVPYRKRTADSPKILNSGKLWAKFINYKRSIVKYSAGPAVNIEIKEEEIFDDEIESSHYLHFLRHKSKPFDEIFAAWRNTFHQRQSLIKHVEIHDFLETLPAIKEPFGFKLLTDDFATLHPDKSYKFLETWPNLANDIIKLVEFNQLIPPEHLNSYSYAKQIMALKYMPLIFPPITIRTRKHIRNWRPSKTEMQLSFFTHVQDNEELTNLLRERRRTLQQNGQTMQPFVAIEGQENITSYVVMNNIVYTLEDPVKAVDVCFKIYFALNLSYSVESAHVWTFVQQKIYNIYTPQDKYLSAVESVSTDLDNIRKC